MKKLFTIFATFAMLCAVGCNNVGFEENMPKDAYILLDKELVIFDSEGESVEVMVFSNYKWSISTSCDWVATSISGGEATVGGQIVTLSAELTYDNREGTIMFSCGNVSKLLVVSQSFQEDIIADENNTLNIPAKGGVAVLNYQTTVDCEVVIPEDAKGWISIAPATRGLVAESAKLNVAENTTYSKRSAVVWVVKKGGNSPFAEYTINQAQKDAVIGDSNNTFNIGGWSQSVALGYKTNVACKVVIPTEAQKWLSVATNATRALVQESATLNVAANNTGAERSAVVKVVAEDNNSLVAEYTITQEQRYVIQYTSTDGNVVKPYASDGFGASIRSNTYENGIGIIDFDRPVTSIGGRAFYDCSSLKSIVIPDSVTSIGDNAFYFCMNLASVTVPEGVTSIGYNAFSNCLSLNSITIPKTVTSIGDSAFIGCSSLAEFKGKFASSDGRCLVIDGMLNSFAPAEITEYTIPNSVTAIGNYAFYNCLSLERVIIPTSVTTIGENSFYYCSSLVSVTIPDSVISIGNYVFSRCSSLESVTIGNGVPSIGEDAFSYCSSLASVTIGNGVTSIGKYAFSHCLSLVSITIPNSVTEIGFRACYDCSGLERVTIPASVTWIGDEAFNGCTGELIINSKIVERDYTINERPAHYGWLKESKFSKLTIGESVEKIGTYSFSLCSSLESVTIGNGVTSIGDDAFTYCERIASVTIPDSVTSIGDYAFSSCSSLASVTIPDGVTSIGERAFSHCSSLQSTTIPDSVISIGECAFGSCTGELIINNKIVETNYNYSNYPTMYGWLMGSKFSKLTIGENVKKIGNYVFRSCESLESVTIGNGVTSIGEYAFDDCSSLVSITIPNSVTSIGGWAFSYCDSLKEVYCKPTTPPAGDYYMFYKVSDLKIYVPTESVQVYKSVKYWNDYKSYIYAYDF